LSKNVCWGYTTSVTISGEGDDSEDTTRGWKTRSQAVARIADRTASQHLRGSRDVIGHVTIR